MRKVFLVVLGLFVALPGVAQEKRRVAVLDFGYGTVMTSVQAIFGSNQDVGKGISDLLINELVNDGRYRVIERSAIDKILKEQNFSNSDRVNTATAAKIGGLLGVDTIIIGDVTQFGRDDKHYGGGGGGGNIWSAGRRFPGHEQVQGSGRSDRAHGRCEHRRDPCFRDRSR